MDIAVPIAPVPAGVSGSASAGVKGLGGLGGSGRGIRAGLVRCWVRWGVGDGKEREKEEGKKETIKPFQDSSQTNYSHHHC